MRGYDAGIDRGRRQFVKIKHTKYKENNQLKTSKQTQKTSINKYIKKTNKKVKQK